MGGESPPTILTGVVSMLSPTEPYNELPMVSSIWMDVSPHMSRLAEDARVAIELLRYAVKTLPDHETLLDTLYLQEARSSSNIENIATTNDDIYRDAVMEESSEEVKAVKKYKAAMEAGFELVKEKQQLALDDIELINRKVNSRHGGIRANLPQFSSLTRIQKTNIGGEKETIYTPPHGKELLMAQLIDMLDYVYDDDNFEVHPLIKIALAHYQFESIHPYHDGNGRTGRILNILFMLEKGYLDFPMLNISSYITRHKSRYYELLQTARETQEYDAFVEFMLISFQKSAQQTLHIVEGIRDLLNYYTDERYLSTLKGQSSALRETIGIVFRKVYVRNSDLTQAELGIHRQTAASYLDQLAEEGLLVKEKKGRDNIYKNIKLLELFDDEREE